MTLAERKSFFHPLEISFVGLSNSGKTTLITKLIKRFSKEFDVGFVKHDAHKFDMDTEGKDTDLASKSGAAKILISSQQENKSAYLINDHNELSAGMILDLIDLDFVLVEGFKKFNLPKLVILDEKLEIEKIYDRGDLQNVMAFIGTTNQLSKLTQLHMPTFDRNDIDKISSFILAHFENILNKYKLCALILGGGKSSRMGSDKGNLAYHGKSQIDYFAELFEQLNLSTFISCRFEQKNDVHLKNKNHIYDQILNMGPSGGIWSALKEHKRRAFVTVACDLPFIDVELLEFLIDHRNPYKVATCFYNSKLNWREPLITIYEPKSFLKFGSYLALDKRCPRKMLKNSNVQEVMLPTELLWKISNINTPEEHLAAVVKIKKQKKRANYECMGNKDV